MPAERATLARPRSLPQRQSYLTQTDRLAWRFFDATRGLAVHRVVGSFGVHSIEFQKASPRGCRIGAATDSPVNGGGLYRRRQLRGRPAAAPALSLVERCVGLVACLVRLLLEFEF
jgi:hypothetical protein